MARFPLKRILLFLITLIVFAAPCVTALIVDVKPSLAPELNEGQTIQYQMVVTGIPQQTSFIILETDLEPINNTLLWNISAPEKYGLGNKSPTLMQKKIQIPSPSDINAPITITFSGRVPTIKQIIPYNGVVLCNVVRTTGYRHFSVTPYDSEGYIVGTGDTRTFNIKPDNDCLPPDIIAVKDPELRPVIQDLSNKGLWQEANKLIDYSKAQPATVSLLVYIVSIIIVGFVMFVIGYRTKKIPKPDYEEDIDREV
jgi:hypothetical protein